MILYGTKQFFKGFKVSCNDHEYNYICADQALGLTSKFIPL